MNIVLEEYENQYDFMYLFANQTVLDFYPKFGFHKASEVQFSYDYTPSNPDESGLQKLDGSNKDHLDFIYKIASKRVPVSSRFGTANTEGLLMFYCIYVFTEDIYFVEEEDAIVIFKGEGEQIDIFDIISRNEVNIENILLKITSNETNRIVFHYTPDYPGIKTLSEIYHSNDVLFVRTSKCQQFPAGVKHPITAIA